MAEKAAKMDFEKSLENLEKVVEELESGALTLDQALKRYEEGVGLIRTCQAKLTETGKKIEVLTQSLDGSFKKEPFDAAAVPGGTGKGKKKKPSSSEDEETEDF